jgi:hypothetical protein
VSAGFLTDPLLLEWKVEHGFGLRGSPEPERLARPCQVHGTAVARADAQGELQPGEADAVWTDAPGLAVGVVTADCVPILMGVRGGVRVVAVHAGWKGLAQGVIGAGVSALRAGSDETVRAAIGPHVGLCCYEVDAPVLGPLRRRFGDDLDVAQVTTGSDRARVDLGALARRALECAGVPRAAIGTAAVACTRCDAERFHSYRRDGARAGRLLHFVRAGNRPEAALDSPQGPA